VSYLNSAVPYRILNLAGKNSAAPRSIEYGFGSDTTPAPTTMSTMTTSAAATTNEQCERAREENEEEDFFEYLLTVDTHMTTE